MGDYADAAIECFGPRLRDRLVPLLSPFRYELIEEPDHLIATIENLAYSGEDGLCQRLRELRIPYEFLHSGDHETEPLLRLYDPQVPESSGTRRLGASGVDRQARTANRSFVRACWVIFLRRCRPTSTTSGFASSSRSLRRFAGGGALLHGVHSPLGCLKRYRRSQ